MRLAYLTSTYPSVSHTFIRRELREIERQGHLVLRVAIRAADTPLVDPLDQEEQDKTWHCLSQPVTRLLLGVLRVICTRPFALVRALGMAIRMGQRSDRGVIRHLAYLTEAAWLLHVLRRYEIEHVHVHFGHNPATVACLIRSLGGPPYSMTVHGTETFDAPGPLSLGQKVADAAFTVAVSDYGSAQLRRWVSLEHWSKIHVVRCTVEDDFLDAASMVDSSANTVVSIGRLAPEKGQLVLIEAVDELVRNGTDAKLVLGGDGPLRMVLERRIRELGLENNVVITGWIDAAEVRRRILQARALVLPSFAEGLPMVIMEAFALRRPVVSTYVAAIPELVRPGVTGWLVTPGRVDALAAALQEVYDTPATQLDVLGTAGQELVRQRHRTSVETARLEQLFARHGGRRATRATPGECPSRRTTTPLPLTPYSRNRSPSRPF